MANKPVTALVSTAADDRLVDAFLQRVRSRMQQAVIDAVVMVGDDAIETFFGGSVELAHSNSPRKASALARLHQRADELPISLSALKRAIRLSIQYRQLPSSVRGALSMRHQVALLPVADEKDKVRLAQEAVARHLTSDQLVTAVRRRAGRKGVRGGSGRQPLPVIVKHVAGLERATRGTPLAALLAAPTLRALDGSALTAVERQLKAVREHVERIADAVTRARRG